MEFRLEAFFGSSVNDAGISFQILAPTLEKTLFWISRPSVKRMNTSSIAEKVFIMLLATFRFLLSCIKQQMDLP